MTELKNKYAMKVFDYENRDDLTEVFNWLKENESKKVKD